jgi:hypothetical protein
MMVCEYEECGKKFRPKTHNQKYCSDECCRTATNLKIKEKYYRNKARLRGEVRYCKGKDCEEKLSRYNELDFCTMCDAKIISQEKRTILEMIKNVNI